MKNNAKKFPLPIGEEWARLPERVAALEGLEGGKFRAFVNTNKKTFKFKVTSNTIGDNLELHLNIKDETSIEIKSPKGIFIDKEKVLVTLSLGGLPFTASSMVKDKNTLVLTTFDKTGTAQKNTLLFDVFLTIEILN